MTIFVNRYDGRKPTCVHWSMPTTSLPARRCQAVELIGVLVGDKIKLMCRLHKADYHRTGKIRTRAMARLIPISTRHYRTRNPK